MTNENDPAECIRASIAPAGGGRFVVYLERADGEHVPPILCTSAAGAAALVREMNPANADALLAELDGSALTLDFMTRFAEAFASGLQ